MKYVCFNGNAKRFPSATPEAKPPVDPNTPYYQIQMCAPWFFHAFVSIGLWQGAPLTQTDPIRASPNYVTVDVHDDLYFDSATVTQPQPPAPVDDEPRNTSIPYPNGPVQNIERFIGKYGTHKKAIVLGSAITLSVANRYPAKAYRSDQIATGYNSAYRVALWPSTLQCKYCPGANPGNLQQDPYFMTLPPSPWAADPQTTPPNGWYFGTIDDLPITPQMNDIMCLPHVKYKIFKAGKACKIKSYMASHKMFNQPKSSYRTDPDYWTIYPEYDETGTNIVNVHVPELQWHWQWAIQRIPDYSEAPKLQGVVGNNHGSENFGNTLVNDFVCNVDVKLYIQFLDRKKSLYYKPDLTLEDYLEDNPMAQAALARNQPADLGELLLGSNPTSQQLRPSTSLQLVDVSHLTAP